MLRDDVRARAGLGLMAACGFAALLLAFACEKSKSGSTGDDVPKESLPTGDAAGIANFCTVAVGSPSNCPFDCFAAGPICECGSTPESFPDATAVACPPDGIPTFCVVGTRNGVLRDGALIDPECACFPKCAGGTFERPPQEPVRTCHCAVEPNLRAMYPDVVEQPAAGCTGYSVCCRGLEGCDCSSDPGYGCAPGAMRVTACTPDDFDESAFQYELPYVAARVDRCR